MQSTASAFPIGQYYAIGETVTTMLFSLILVHFVFFLGVLFRTLRDSSFQIGKRRDRPRTFHCIYICSNAGISLILSLTLKESTSFVTNHRRPKLESSKTLHLYLRRNCDGTRRILSTTARPPIVPRVATAIHGLGIGEDSCSPRDPWLVLVCKGPCAQGHH